MIWAGSNDMGMSSHDMGMGSNDMGMGSTVMNWVLPYSNDMGMGSIDIWAWVLMIWVCTNSKSPHPV